MRSHILRQVGGNDSGFLAVLSFNRGRYRMRAVQPPLLPNADHAAGQNVDRESARNWENHEHSGEGQRHELHHHLLLRVSRGHRRHFRD